jgi:hypothetical protein
MIDWKKPLVCNYFADPKLHFIGFTPDYCFAVVMSASSGSLYKVDVNTCRIVGYNTDSCKVENKKEPWEKAWEAYDKDYCYFSRQQEFKKIFELGLNWCQNKS